MTNNIESLIGRAARLRAKGETWVHIAREVQRAPATVRHWPSRFPELWSRESPPPLPDAFPFRDTPSPVRKRTAPARPRVAESERNAPSSWPRDPVSAPCPLESPPDPQDVPVSANQRLAQLLLLDPDRFFRTMEIIFEEKRVEREKAQRAAAANCPTMPPTARPYVPPTAPMPARPDPRPSGRGVLGLISNCVWALVLVLAGMVIGQLASGQAGSQCYADTGAPSVGQKEGQAGSLSYRDAGSHSVGQFGSSSYANVGAPLAGQVCNLFDGKKTQDDERAHPCGQFGDISQVEQIR